MYVTTDHNTLRVTKITLGALATNCYFIWDAKSREAVIIDPADSGEFLIEVANELALTPTAIVFTHAHFDHVLGAFALTALLQIPTWLHPADAPLLTTAQLSAHHWLGYPVDPVPPATHVLTENTTFKLGSEVLTVLHLPGHTPGSVGIGVFAGESPFICSGDLVTDEGHGSTHHRYSNLVALEHSLKKLSELPTSTYYYPGHGNLLTQPDLKAMLAEYLAASVQ